MNDTNKKVGVGKEPRTLPRKKEKHGAPLLFLDDLGRMPSEISITIEQQGEDIACEMNIMYA